MKGEYLRPGGVGDVRSNVQPAHVPEPPELHLAGGTVGSRSRAPRGAEPGAPIRLTPTPNRPSAAPVFSPSAAARPAPRRRRRRGAARAPRARAAPRSTTAGPPRRPRRRRASRRTPTGRSARGARPRRAGKAAQARQGARGQRLVRAVAREHPEAGKQARAAMMAGGDLLGLLGVD